MGRRRRKPSPKVLPLASHRVSRTLTMSAMIQRSMGCAGAKELKSSVSLSGLMVVVKVFHRRNLDTSQPSGIEPPPKASNCCLLAHGTRAYRASMRIGRKQRFIVKDRP